MKPMDESDEPANSKDKCQKNDEIEKTWKRSECLFFPVSEGQAMYVCISMFSILHLLS